MHIPPHSGRAETIVSSTGNTVNNTTSQYETIYGAGLKVHIGGGKVSGTNLVGGFGRQFIDLNSGVKHRHLPFGRRLDAHVAASTPFRASRR